MPQIIVLKAFSFAHRGVEVQELHPSDKPQEVAQEVVDHAGLIEEGYIELVDDVPSESPAPAPQPSAEAAAAPVSPTPAPARKTSGKKAAQ